MVYQIIPIIDKFNVLFTDMIRNEKLHLSIRHAAQMGSRVLDKYYTLTDESEVYRTSMSTSHYIYSFSGTKLVL
jgi:hypothetical protein